MGSEIVFKSVLRFVTCHIIGHFFCLPLLTLLEKAAIICITTDNFLMGHVKMSPGGQRLFLGPIS